MCSYMQKCNSASESMSYIRNQKTAYSYTCQRSLGIWHVIIDVIARRSLVKLIATSEMSAHFINIFCFETALKF